MTCNPIVVLALVCLSLPTLAQTEPYTEPPNTTLGRVLGYPSKLSRDLQQQQQTIATRLQRKTAQYLHRLQQQEKKMARQLRGKDSATVAQLHLGSDSVYRALEATLHNGKANLDKLPPTYSAKLDSMVTALHFLEKDPRFAQLTGPEFQQLKSQYQQLGGQLNQVEHLKNLARERKALLQEKLKQLPLGKSWSKYQKQVIYYQQQLEEYKNMIEHPQDIERKALSLLREVPAFRKFFDKYSVLGSMFRLPGQTEDMNIADITGLQTRSSVMQQVTERFGNAGAAQQAINAGMDQGQSELAALKNKLMRSLESGESLDMPGFKPNDQKSKTFLKRLELVTNLQSVPSNRFIPVTTDFGLSLGYKLNRKSVVGVGASYKMGWGQNIRHLKITHEGMGIRTFVDVRVQKSFWLTGGGEWNYRARFHDLAILKTVNQWQRSALIGVQKKQKLGKYSSTASILYDALWNQHVPNSQPILFRVGYNIK